MSRVVRPPAASSMTSGDCSIRSSVFSSPPLICSMYSALSSASALVASSSDAILATKHQPKANKMIFVGYSDAQKAWKCYDPNTNTVVCSTNVRFDNESIPANGQKTDIPSIMDMLSPSSPTTEMVSDNLASHTSLEINPVLKCLLQGWTNQLTKSLLISNPM